MFSPYGQPYTLPIPVSAQPKAVTMAPNVNYPSASSGGLKTLANATTDFGLRFVGEQSILKCALLLPLDRSNASTQSE